MSCRAAVTGAEVKAGASLVLATVMENDWLSEAPSASVTDRTMEADPTQAYNQNDATGFIALNALRLKVAARVHGISK